MLLVVATLSACATPRLALEVPCDAPAAPVGSAALALPSSATLLVEVVDGRSERPLDSLGVVRMTMGIPCALLQREGLSVADALRVALRDGLAGAGWPLREASSERTGWTLRLTLDRLWCDGYFNEFTYAIGVRLHLLDAAGHLRARAERHQDLVLPYRHPADMAFQASELVRLALGVMLSELELGVHLRAQREPPPPARPGGVRPQPPAERACPGCQAPAEAEWKHCPACGSKL